jgi:hypothetical protein
VWNLGSRLSARAVQIVPSRTTFEGQLTEITDPTEMKRTVALMRKKYPISIPYLWIKKKPDGAFRVRLEER